MAKNANGSSPSERGKERSPPQATPLDKEKEKEKKKQTSRRKGDYPRVGRGKEDVIAHLEKGEGIVELAIKTC